MKKQLQKKSTSTFLNQLIIGLIINFVWFSIATLLGIYFKVWPNYHKLESRLDNLDSLKIQFDQIQKTYSIPKEKDGILIYVGINSELGGNNASVYIDNKLTLKYGDIFYLSNKEDPYNCTLKFIVTRENKETGVFTDANLFISKDAAKRLGLNTKNNQGIYPVNFKIQCKG